MARHAARLEKMEQATGTAMRTVFVTPSGGYVNIDGEDVPVETVAEWREQGAVVAVFDEALREV